MTQALTNATAGVNYDDLDPFKRRMQEVAARTSENARRLGWTVVEESRGESCFLMRNGINFVGHVEEGLGTKNDVAHAMRKLTGRTYYDQIMQDNVAMAVNDMITLGVMPASYALHFAVGDGKFLDDPQLIDDVGVGMEKACDLARCVFGPGETPALKGLIYPDAAVLSGSVIGSAHYGVLGPNAIQVGDAIVILESSGIHSNALSMARAVGARFNRGYAVELPSGRPYGEVLLDPTHIYVGAIEELLTTKIAPPTSKKIDLHYAVNITGHGWRKFMRATRSFTYVIDTLPTEREIFPFLQEHGPIDDREAYASLNMGAGFAIYLPESDVEDALRILEPFEKSQGFRSFRAGHIEAGEKKVVIDPKNIVYTADTLAVR